MSKMHTSLPSTNTKLIFSIWTSFYRSVEKWRVFSQLSEKLRISNRRIETPYPIWKPDWGSSKSSDTQIDVHHTGVRWVIISLMEQHQLHSTPDLGHLICTAQRDWIAVLHRSSLESLSLRLGASRRRKLQLLVFVHTGYLLVCTCACTLFPHLELYKVTALPVQSLTHSGKALPVPTAPGIGPSHGCAHVKTAH